jgi:predicted DNA-binding protein with PD1-like motif
MPSSLRRETRLFSGLQEFAEKYQIQSAHFTAIGALNGATLAWFDPNGKCIGGFLSTVRSRWFQ